MEERVGNQVRFRWCARCVPSPADENRAPRRSEPRQNQQRISLAARLRAALLLSTPNKGVSLAARLDDILKTGGSSSSRMCAAGLGGMPQSTKQGRILNCGLSQAMQWPHSFFCLLDLTLETPPQKESVTIKNGEPGTPLVNPGEVLPLSPEWRDILGPLLNELGFDPREQIGKVPRYSAKINSLNLRALHRRSLMRS